MGMSYTTGDFYTNGTSGLGATKAVSKPKPKPAPNKISSPLPPLKRHVMNGVGAPMVDGDFGSTMGFSVFGVDLGAELTKAYKSGVSALQTSATKEVNKQLTTFVNKITGQKVTLTPEQQAQYDKDKTLPGELVGAQPTFMDQYGKYIMIGGGVLAGLVALSLIVKMVKK